MQTFSCYTHSSWASESYQQFSVRFPLILGGLEQQGKRNLPGTGFETFLQLVDRTIIIVLQLQRQQCCKHPLSLAVIIEATAVYPALIVRTSATATHLFAVEPSDLPPTDGIPQVHYHWYPFHHGAANIHPGLAGNTFHMHHTSHDPGRGLPSWRFSGCSR